MNDYYVYQLRVEDEELPFYIGKGRADRANRHLIEKAVTNGNLHKSRKIAKAIRNNKKVLIEFIEQNLTESESLEREVFWIAHFGRADLKKGCLTNMTNGGEGISGYTHTEETRKKLSELASGPNSPWYGIGFMTGKQLPDSAKLKMSQARKGEKNPFFNKTHDEETRLKMSLAKKGKPQVSEGFRNRNHSKDSVNRIKDSCSKVTYKITRPDGVVEIIRNLREYCKIHNLTAPNMIVVANGVRQFHKGFRCERIPSE